MNRTLRDATAWAMACDHLGRGDPVMAALLDRYAGETLVPHGDVFRTLARAVTGQQISVPAAERIWERLVDRLGAIEPAAVLRVGAEALAACGLTRRKAAALVAIADGWGDGPPATREALLALPGVGPWTADMVAIFALGESDVLPLADIGLHRAMERHYAIARADLDAAAIERLSACWRPWRSVAVWYLWRDLDPVPVAY